MLKYTNMDTAEKKQKRWELAIKFEGSEWKSSPKVFEEEFEESRQKFGAYFKEAESLLGVQENWKILDVGCNATCLSGMIEKGLHYGIDPLADELNIQERVPNFEIKNATGEKIPYPNEYFNLVVCVNVIDHTCDPTKVIEEINRVIGKEGYLIISVYIYNSFICLMRRLAEKVPGLRNVGHPHTFSQKDFEKLVGKYFKIMSSTVIYEGNGPLNFGKVQQMDTKLPPIQAFVSFINSKILGYKWFVREQCLICRKTL